MADLAVETLRGAPPAGPTESDFSPRKIRSAFVVLFGQTFATSILPFMALGYVLVPMTTEFGWTRAQFSLANSFLMLFGALTVWGLGWMTDKIGVRPIILLGTIAVGLVTLLIPQVQHLWQFYALFALLGVFGSSGASYAKVIAALFTQNRGKAMAVFGAEGTAVRAFIPMITSFLILNYSWRGMFAVFGTVILLIVPLLYFGLEEPGTRGLLPKLGFRRRAAAAAAAPPPPPPMVFDGLSMGEALKDRVFWLMLSAGLISMVVSNGLLTNTIAAITDKGFTQTAAATMMFWATWVGLGGTLLGGWMMDRFQTVKVAIPFAMLTALGYFLLMIVTPRFGGEAMLFAALGLWMFAIAASFPMVAYFATRYFGLKSFAQIAGFQAMVQAICMGLTAPLVGQIYDQTGSYTIAFWMGIGAALLSAAVYLILPAYRFSANIGAMPAAAPAKA